ncbi:Potassium uptake protein TrkA [Syntrophomonas zehnderi OL-4]|uniref:Trk system potassium uptake protein TrkA n=1 Tax=Syntrophomonas zehnderi OL-4 TaxID=690567 RepID=A0A0E4C7I3_9FIRM|nr:Trk system potassium transporter TrkA [Syntrophomonas zehnderi]CFW99504.1 Potassium uptake protein TrkA [Syntrophomonas zehnderi OL-4]
MKAIIIGAGKVGFSMAELLSSENHDVVVIEQSRERQRIVEESLDVQVVYGSGSSTSVLEYAGVRSADLFLAVTEYDELNMVACLLAKKYGVKSTVARVRNPEYLEVRDFALNEIMGIDLIINPERVTAQEIFRIVRNPEALSVDYFADGKVQMIELELKEGSPLLGKRIKDLDSSVPYNIVSIARKHKMLVPSGEDVFQLGDHINVMAQTLEMREVKKILGFQSRKVDNVTILGGGRTGCYLAQMLEHIRPPIQIKIIEKDLFRARMISEKLDHTLVIHGDGSDYQLLESENVSSSDIFVAVTDDDKINLLCALIARNLGAKKTVCQMKRTDVMPLVNQIGIDAILSPRLITAGAILKYMRAGNIISVTLFGEDRAEMLELLAQPGAKAVGKALKYVRLPMGSVIGAVVREDQVIIPDGNFKINPHDRLMVFSLPKHIRRTEQLFLNGGGR